MDKKLEPVDSTRTDDDKASIKDLVAQVQNFLNLNSDKEEEAEDKRTSDEAGTKEASASSNEERAELKLTSCGTDGGLVVPVPEKEVKNVEDDDEKEEEEDKDAVISISIHPLLKDYKDCFFDWIPDQEKFTKEVISTMASVLSSKYVNFSEEMLLTEIQILPFETASNHLSLTFCHLLLKDVIQAQASMKVVGKVISLASNLESITTNHLEGLVYLFTGLDIHKQALSLASLKSLTGTEISKGQEAHLKSLLDDATPYKDLSNGARVAIKGVRAFFLETCRHLPQQLQILQEIISAEPENIEWLVQLHQARRLQRKELDRTEGPSNEEKYTVLRYLQLDPDHPAVKLGVCQYLTDVLRFRQWNVRQGPLTLGTISFKTLDEVAAYIREKSGEILETMGHSVKFNYCIAEFFTTTLPSKYRDSVFAKKCYYKALATNPSSSKINHKLGLLHLLTEKNAEEAINCFQKAFHKDARNFSALIDLLQGMMGNKEKYRETIESLFTEHLGKETWKVSQRGSLLMLFALWNLMWDRKEVAMRSWINAYKFLPESLQSLKQLQYHINRYMWQKEEKINPDVVQQWLKLAERTGKIETAPGVEVELEFTPDDNIALMSAYNQLSKGIQDQLSRSCFYPGSSAFQGRGRNREGGRRSNGDYPPRTTATGEEGPWRGKEPSGGGNFVENGTNNEGGGMSGKCP